MGMTLKKIELWNIRAHKHFLFEPNESGITSVSGSNGSGKSTIVDSFAWALYGTKINNTKNKLLIKDYVNPKKEEVKVEVEIQVDKNIYLIRRSIIGEGGGSDCNVYGKTADGEFNHLAGPAVGSAERFIKQILKMDEKGFLTAIFIQQKQVDQIVSSTPRERSEVIEKLTGIQSITNAITLARDEAKSCQKAANVITLEDIDSLTDVIKSSIAEGKQLREETDIVKLQLESETIKFNKEKEAFNEEDIKNRNGKELFHELTLEKEKLKMKNKEMDRVIEVISEYKKETKTIVTNNPDKLEKEVNTANQEYLTLERELKVSKDKIAETEVRINEINNLNLPSISKIINEINEKEQKLEELILNEKKISNEIQSINGEERQINKSLSTLNDDITECPICKAHISDPDELRKEIEHEIEGIRNKKSNLKKDYKLIQNEIKEEKEFVFDLKVKRDLIVEHEELNKSLPLINNELNSLLDNEKELKLNLSIIKKQYTKALQVKLKADEVKKAKVRVEALTNEIKVITSNIKDLSKRLEDNPYLTDRELSGIKLKLEKKSKEINKKTLENNDNLSKLNYLRNRVSDLKTQYASAKSANDKYQNLIETMKTANISSTLMAEFKEDRIKVAIPALEMYASTILSKFTDGKFVKVELDSKFNTFVTTNSGKIRPVGPLSGGELSAVAIALRLGISMLLNEGDNNVLILDEILVSMDETRARHIIETITSITNCQVIFIAHNSDINNIADKVIQINPEVEEASENQKV